MLGIAEYLDTAQQAVSKRIPSSSNTRPNRIIGISPLTRPYPQITNANSSFPERKLGTLGTSTARRMSQALMSELAPAPD